MLMPSNRISSVFWSPVLFSFRRNLHAEINYDPITQLPLTFLLHETSTTSTPTSTKAAWTVSPHFPIHVMLQHLELHFKQPLDTSNLFTRISSPSQSNHLRWCRSVSLLDIVKYTLFHQAQLEWRCPQLSFEIMLPSFEGMNNFKENVFSPIIKNKKKLN
ncbi:hypothetical protein HMI55_002484 [Coelomomyces lativittatus]|nr:hypothetical protein HMI55_002484 [Coelomomyces lativittatus]